MSKNITITKFKYYPELTEETYCFSAEVHLDGKRIGTAKNEGHGGETRLDLDKFGLIPHEDYNEVIGVIDELVDDAVKQKAIDKDMRTAAKKLAKTLVFRTKGQRDGAYYEIRGNPNDPELRERVKKQAEKKGEEIELIVNDLPIDKAVHFLFRYE